MTDNGLSNPFSTGGGGSSFEQHVAACYMVSLLREDVPRGLYGGTAENIRFQARQQGVLLDDLLITTNDGLVHRHLALQIKHKLIFSADNETFKEVMLAAWATYNSISGWQFCFNRDRLGLGIGVITGTIREHLLPLLEWARACLSAQEFVNKVNTSRYSHEEKRKYLTTFHTVLNEVAGKPVTYDALWTFLRHLVVLDFDLEYEGSRDATIAWNHLLDIALHRDSAQARTIFDKLVVEASKLAPLAGTIDVERVRNMVSDIVTLPPRRGLAADLHLVYNHAMHVLNGIRDNLASQMYLPRTELLLSVWDALETASILCITGSPGSGKSAVLRSIAQQLTNEGQIFLLRAEELDYPMLEGFMRGLGVQHSIEEILQGLSGTSRRCLLIDGLEHVLSLRHKNCLNNLLNSIIRQNDLLYAQGISEKHHWKIICTCRESVLESILSHLPALAQAIGQGYLRVIKVEPLTNEEVQEVITAFPDIQSLWQDVRLQGLLRLPLYLDIITRQKLVPQKLTSNEKATEAWFAEEFWHGIIRRGDGMRDGLGEPLARDQTMLEVVRRSLQLHRPWVPIRDLNPQAVQGLILDKVLREEDATVTFAHDVLGDWAIYKLLAQARDKVVAEIEQYQESHFLDRPLQLLACHLLEYSESAAEWLRLMTTFEKQVNVSPRWHDIILTAPLFSACLSDILPRIETVLLDEYGGRLAQLLIALRSIATAPDPMLNVLFQDSEQKEREKYLPYVRVPLEQIWIPMLHFLLRLGHEIPPNALQPASEVMKMWMQKTHSGASLRREVASFALSFLFSEENDKDEEEEDEGNDEDDEEEDEINYGDTREIEKNLVNALFAGADCLRTEIDQIVRHWMEQGITSSMPHGYFTLRDEILSPEAIPPLCQYLPQLLADVARYELIITHNDYRSHDLRDLGIRDGHDWFPPDQFKGPFLGLLRFAPMMGMDLILDLTNHATQAWVTRERRPRYGGEGTKPLPQKLSLGTEVREIWGDAQVWQWFRYPSVAPNAITSALIALEHWLSDLLKRSIDPKPFFDYFIQRTGSAAIIGILSSIAMKFPEKCADAIIPILFCPGFWIMDKERLSHDQTNAIMTNSEEPNWIWITRSAREEHRQRELESLALYLMLADATYQAQLLPVIRSFPDNLPYTDEGQIGNVAAEANLRQQCEFLVLRTDIANFTPVDIGNGIISFEPKETPEHLANVVQESQKKTAQFQELIGLKMWAIKLLDGEPDNNRYTPATALTSVRRITSEMANGTEDLFLMRTCREVVALVAAVLVCCYSDWLCNQDDIQWCRDQLFLVEVEEKAELHEYVRYPWGRLRSSARALPYLLAKSPHDMELRGAAALLSIHQVEEVREYTYTALKQLWTVMPNFIWKCIALGVELAIRLQHMGEEGQDEAFLSWLETEIERIAEDKPGIDPEELSKKTFVKVHWNRLESVVRALPECITTLPHDWQGKLLHLYEDWLRFTISVHIDLEGAETDIRLHRYRPNKWDCLFFDSLAQQLVAQSPVEVAQRLVDFILETWERTPEMMENFMRSFLRVGSEQALSAKEFVYLWKHIGHRMLSNNMIQSCRFRYEHSIETSLAILVFADPYTHWLVKQWEPLNDFVDLIGQWVTTVGQVPSCFRALIRLLTTIGFPFFAAYGVEWISLCLASATSPDTLLREGSNAVALSSVLMKAYNEQREALVASEVTWRKFNALVDRLVRIGEPVAVDLQQKIRGFDSSR